MEGNRHLGLLILIGLILICTLQDSVAIEAPAIVSVENEGTTDSLNVTWTPPADATAHVVTWSLPDGSGSGTSPDPISGTATEYIISGLTPGTLYSVTVTAKNGTDEMSDGSGQGTTKPSPVNLTESGATNDSISAEWTRPSGAVDQYTFSCSNGTEDPSSPIDEDGSAVYEASCMGLSTAGANYTITVTSQSGIEKSDDTTITIIAYPNTVVLHVEEGGITTRQITVQWDNPVGEEDSFNVDCGDDGSNDFTLLPADATNNIFQATCNVTMAGAPYSITVTSVSGDKESPITGTFTAATPEGVTFGESSSSTTAVTVTWNELVDADGFRVNCSDGAPSPNSSLSGSATEVTCDGVTSGGNHSVSVVTLENGGESAATVVYVVALPEAVTLNEVDNMVTNTTIVASWTDVTGEFDYYEVNCSDGTASPAQVNPSDAKTASCTGLSTPGDDYDISVTTVSNGQRSETDTITITALPNAVSLSEGGSTNTTISATWKLPDGVVDTFNITCPIGVASPASILVESSPTSDTFTASCIELSLPGLEYDLSVVAISNGKPSAVQTVSVHTSPTGVFLTEGPASTTSVSVNWAKPDSPVESYSISCSSGDASPVTIEDTSQPSYMASCINLTVPGDTYTMTVDSIVDSGATTTSSSIILVALPSQVTNLTEAGATNDSVSSKWTKPDGVVSSYSVTCPDGSIQAVPENDDDSPRTVTCSNLPDPGPGVNHIITVVTLSDDKASDPATITITAFPNSVVLREDGVTTRQITVQWVDPVGEEDSFIVDCGDDGSNDITLLPGDATNNIFQATCNVPMAGAPFDITVTSVSGDKESPVTGTFIAATPEGVTFGESSSSTTAVTVTWIALAGADMFTVACSDGAPSPNSPLLGSATEVTCDGVTPGGNHSVTVVTQENNGESPAVVMYVVAVPEAVTLNEESNMVNTTTITASWTMPNGIVDYYEVFCSDGTASPAQVNPPDALTASCTGLSTPGDDYTISVMSVSNSKLSAASSIIITALPEAVELSEGESNTTAISATWTVPNSVVDTFTVTCSNGTASPPSIPVISGQAGEQLTAYCVELPESGEQYDLSVVAISNEKLSAISTVGVFALPLGVDLEEGLSTLMSVSASWMRQNDTVESYSITCSHGDASPSTIEDTDQESFSAACVNLTRPGATYSMTVYSEVGTDSSSNGSRASSSITLVAVPESVESITVTEPTTTTVDVQWNLIECSECVYNYFLLTFKPDSQEPIRVDYTTGVNEYSSQVSNLTEGRSYNFTVVSVSGVGVEDATLKTSEGKSVDQRTVPAAPFGLDILSSQRELNLEWGYQGDADNFTITVTPDHGIAVFNGDFSQPAAEITGLTPGTTYLVDVVTVSGDERSEPITQTARTETDKPSPVRNPRAEAVDKNTIILTYESPVEPNGEITFYRISYVGTRDGNPNHEFSDVYGVVLTVTYNDLRAGFSYIFKIIAVNDGEFDSDPVSTEPVETPQDEPSPVPEDYPYEANTVFSETSTTSFAVVLPDDLFSHDNGELSTFAVIITIDANDQTVGSTELTYDEARAQNGNMPAYITAIDIPYPYPPSFGSNRKRRATEPSATVVIGNGTCAGSPKEYCNGRLNDNTEYYYAFRAYNGMGNVTSSTFGPVKTVKDNTAAIAAGVSVSLIIIIVAVVVVVVYLKRRQPKEPSPRPSLEGRENQGYDGPDHEMRPTRRKTGGSMHRKSHSKPIVLNKFEGHYGRMKADSDFRFTEEYDEIRLVGKDQAIVSALEMVNRAKNRFTNILPYEHSRVKLAALADDSDTDYINANYIPGYNSPREFMACQGPLPGTVDDMWRMIWEKKTSIIVMLTQLVEKGKIKCHEYWPADYNPVTYGSIQVSVQALQQYDHWVIREFSISQGDEIRKLTQYHFMSWPDHGVPDKTWTMLDFVRTVREAIQKTASDRPIVAHCSAGVGRTGTYIALDRLMQAMQENDYIDIFGIICEMRMQRNHMVQTEKQYIFIHECVMDLLRRGEEEDTGESIYVNLPSNGFKDPDDVNKNLLDQAV